MRTLETGLIDVGHPVRFVREGFLFPLVDPNFKMGQTLGKVAVINPALPLRADCHSGCSLDSMHGCYRGCRSKFFFYLWSGHYLFVYSVPNRCIGYFIKKLFLL